MKTLKFLLMSSVIGLMPPLAVWAQTSDTANLNTKTPLKAYNTAAQGNSTSEAPQSFFVDDVIGQPGAHAIVNILIKGKVTNRSYLMIGGLPEGFGLTAGIKQGKLWIVTLPDINNLSITCPTDFIGSFKLDVMLIRDENISDRARVSVEVINTTQKDETVKHPTPQERAEFDKQMAKAKQLLDTNDIAAARLIYGRLARSGSADAAVALARTYDPIFFEKYATSGIKPDLDQAKHWYAEAIQLGSNDARGHLLTTKP